MAESDPKASAIEPVQVYVTGKFKSMLVASIDAVAQDAGQPDS